MFKSKKQKQITKNDIIETQDTIILNIIPISDFKTNTLSLTEFNIDKGINAFIGKLNNKDSNNEIQAYYFDSSKWQPDSILEWYNTQILGELSNNLAIETIDDGIYLYGYELVFEEGAYRDYVSQLLERYDWLKMTIDDFPFAQKGTSKEMAKNYNPQIYEAPLMLDHGRNDNYYDKAMGWITSLKSVGSKLYAKIENITPEGREMLSNQYYKYKSVGMDVLANVGKYLFELSLTNQPALPNLGAVKLSRTLSGIDRDMYICTLSNDLRLNYDINGGLNMAQNSDNTLLSEIESLKEKLSSLENDVKSKDLLIEQFRADKMATEKQARLSHVTNKVENWIETGKIIPAVYEQFGSKEAYIEKLSNMNAENFDILDKTYSASEPNPLLTLTLPKNETLTRTNVDYINPSFEKLEQIKEYAKQNKIDVDAPNGLSLAINLWKKDKEGGI
jgi:hypothetical protein